MNQKGSLLFCTFKGCPQELNFRPGWRKTCHSKGKFYGASKHDCGTPSGTVPCEYITRALATEHKSQFVDRHSEQGKELQTQTGWRKTNFVWVPEDTTVKPIRGNVETKRVRAHVSDTDVHLDREPVPKKQADGSSAQTQSEDLWTEQLCSAACCLLGAYDALEAQKILNQLAQETDAVLANAKLNFCFCSLCKTSLSMVGYKVPEATLSPTSLCCSHCRTQGMHVVRLASKHQLNCWSKLLGSKPDCRAPAHVEVLWPNVIHGFCASHKMDPATLLEGIATEALEDYACLHSVCRLLAGLSASQYDVQSDNFFVPASGLTRPAVQAEVDEALAGTDPVAAATDLFDRGLYFQCNFEPKIEVESKPCQVLMSVKAARPGSQNFEAARGLTDTSHTGLLMLGKAGLGTKFHEDRTQAENIAFSLTHKTKGKAKAKKDGSQTRFVTQFQLARWWFVHPHVAPKFAEFVRDSMHHAHGIQDFMPKPEHWEPMLAFGAENAIL